MHKIIRAKTEPSFRAVLVFPVGKPHLVASHPAAAPLSAVDLPPAAAFRRCKTSPRNPGFGKTTGPMPFRGPYPARFHGRL